MEIKQLITFKTAAENLNFTQTAKRLKYAQSSVTAQIKSLEKELDTQLFERLGKKLYLTESGRQFKNYADKLIALSEEAKLVTSGLTEPAGTLIIGAQESQCTYRLPPLLKEFKDQFPNVKLIFKPAHSDEMAKEQLLNGELDAAFIMDVLKTEETLTVEPLMQDEMKLVASPDHPLVNKEKVFSYDLEQETLLLTEKGCSYRKILEESLREDDVYPVNQFEFVSIEAIKQCVIAGLGIAILPAMVVEKDINHGLMKELKWEHSTPSLFTQIAWHKDKLLTVPLMSFVELTRRTLKGENMKEMNGQNNQQLNV
ncbi:LysR family transcriptional regulator [Virgibacillus dakarensis]|uniref:LysR family transcriptional regulator n=1 Tax=Lentibacillus populi TaxID=1827502 RepID=A0A9W5U1Y1_9BACI|nr:MULTISPECIES: LysR family transcriptional regulator [Bacillaceae]MBT2218496.1 LysR family transcriptional regulator [Virgibacillus dakarensis]MTW86684.1 LysR family transcriptional regulator [Virgibacillus dakarensis]GGB62617.1 LysR family transcriptional regulator [Lentibacillus populi]